MRLKLVLYSMIAALLISGIAWAADALTTTDEERLEVLADALSNPSNRLSGLLAWSDPSRMALSVHDAQGTRRIGDDADLADELGQTLAPLDGSTEVVQRTITVQEQHATIALRVRGQGEVHDL